MAATSRVLTGDQRRPGLISQLLVPLEVTVEDVELVVDLADAFLKLAELLMDRLLGFEEVIGIVTRCAVDRLIRWHLVDVAAFHLFHGPNLAVVVGACPGDLMDRRHLGVLLEIGRLLVMPRLLRVVLEGGALLIDCVFSGWACVLCQLPLRLHLVLLGGAYWGSSSRDRCFRVLFESAINLNYVVLDAGLWFGPGERPGIQRTITTFVILSAS